jgi:transposase-like protein
MPRLSEEKRLKIVELVEKGMPQSHIAKQLGCSSTIVKKWFERFQKNPLRSPFDQVKIRKRKTTVEQDNLIRKVYYEAGGCEKAKEVLDVEHGLKISIVTIMNRVNVEKKKKYDQMETTDNVPKKTDINKTD